MYTLVHEDLSTEPTNKFPTAVGFRSKSIEKSMKKIIIGKFGAPFSVRGWIKLYSYTDPITNLLNYPLLFVEQRNSWKPLKISDGKAQGDYLVAKIDGIDDRDEVRQLTNCLVGVDREALPKLPENEYYWEDLVGLDVENLEAIPLGKITQMLATGSNDVMQVELNEKRRLIPYTSDAVKKVDLANNKMIVDWDPEF